LVIITTVVELFFLFLLAALASSWGRIVYLWLVYITITIDVTLRSSTAITLLCALIVPRDAALVVDMGVGHAFSIISVPQFADVAGFALAVLNPKFGNVVGSHYCTIVVASIPSVTLWRVGCWGEVTRPLKVADRCTH